jgi:RNA polymerase sigma-70 factor, ECF subfamily
MRTDLMQQLVIENLSLFQNELKGFVFKRVKDMSLTEDIIHDVFLKVHANLNQLQRHVKVTSWIYQITQNTITDHFRKQKRKINPSDLDWENDLPNFNVCVIKYLDELLKTLPDKYREALQLTEIENLSQLELAQRLNISYSGAKSRVQRARKMLKERLEEVLIVKVDCNRNVIVCENRIVCC